MNFNFSGHKTGIWIAIVISLMVGLGGVIFGLISSYADAEVISFQEQLTRTEMRSLQNEQIIYKVEETLAVQANEMKHINRQLEEIKELLKGEIR